MSSRDALLGEVWRSLDVLRTRHKVLVPPQRARAVIIVDLVSWNERSSGGVMASLAFISFYFPRSTDIARHAGTQARRREIKSSERLDGPSTTPPVNRFQPLVRCNDL